MRKMNGGFRDYLNESGAVLRAAGDNIEQNLLDGVVESIVAALSSGKPLLVCGNGGSAADAIHVTAELVGRFLLSRRALKVICLSENPALLTAWSNDVGFDTAFARQVEAYGESGAVLLGISTSGRSRNVIAAFRQARKMGVSTIALTGEGGGELADHADWLLAVPSQITHLVQQVHLCIYHYLCQRIESRLAQPSAGADAPTE
jgi:D-sedoheptulose 7-phosphate isomerase